MISIQENALPLLKTDSFTQDGNEALVNSIGLLLKDLEIPYKLQQVPHSYENISKRQFNLLAIAGDPLVDRKIMKGLLLLSPLDTPGKSSKTAGRDPFRIEGDRLLGEGAISGKLDFLCKLIAISRVRRDRLVQPIYLVGTCGAHYGAFGSRFLLESRSFNPKYSFVGAPTDLGIGVAHKSWSKYRVSIGYANVERDSRGYNRRVSLNVSEARGQGMAANALHCMLSFIRDLLSCGFEFRVSSLSGGNGFSFAPREANLTFCLTPHQFEDFKRYFRENFGNHPDATFRIEYGGIGDQGIQFLPPELIDCLFSIQEALTGINSEMGSESNPEFFESKSFVDLTQIEPGLARTNLSLDTCQLPNTNEKNADKLVQERIREVSRKYSSLVLSSTKIFHSPAFPRSDSVALMAVYRNASTTAGIGQDPYFSSVHNEAGRFHADGLDVVFFGAGKTRTVGLTEEWVSLSDLEKAIAFYQALIERVCA